MLNSEEEKGNAGQFELDLIGGRAKSLVQDMPYEWTRTVLPDDNTPQDGKGRVFVQPSAGTTGGFESDPPRKNDGIPESRNSKIGR